MAPPSKNPPIPRAEYRRPRDRVCCIQGEATPRRGPTELSDFCLPQTRWTRRQARKVASPCNLFVYLSQLVPTSHRGGG